VALTLQRDRPPASAVKPRGFIRGKPPRRLERGRRRAFTDRLHLTRRPARRRRKPAGHSRRRTVRPARRPSARPAAAGQCKARLVGVFPRLHRRGAEPDRFVTRLRIRQTGRKSGGSGREDFSAYCQRRDEPHLLRGEVTSRLAIFWKLPLKQVLFAGWILFPPGIAVRCGAPVMVAGLRAGEGARCENPPRTRMPPR
jgi:hypothetical protein